MLMKLIRTNIQPSHPKVMEHWLPLFATASIQTDFEIAPLCLMRATSGWTRYTTWYDSQWQVLFPSWAQLYWGQWWDMSAIESPRVVVRDVLSKLFDPVGERHVYDGDPCRLLHHFCTLRPIRKRSLEWFFLPSEDMGVSPTIIDISISLLLTLEMKMDQHVRIIRFGSRLAHKAHVITK